MRSRCLKTCSDRLSYPLIKPVHNVTLVTLIYTTTDSHNRIKIRDKSVSIWLAMLFVGCVANVWIPVLVARYFNFSSFLTLAKIQYSAKSEIFVFPETSGLAWHCFQGGDHIGIIAWIIDSHFLSHIPSCLTLNIFLDRALQVNHFEHS